MAVSLPSLSLRDWSLTLLVSKWLPPFPELESVSQNYTSQQRSWLSLSKEILPIQVLENISEKRLSACTWEGNESSSDNYGFRRMGYHTNQSVFASLI